ncbi:MAG: hypothetical protein PHX43_07475 [Alphaproteobacteria bacterium]|nr:hypothetical protein [Alphaproteobacteria bacterium]
MTKNQQLMQDVAKCAVMAALAVIAMPDLAIAADRLSGTVADVGDQIATLPNLISLGCYVGGIVMMSSGALKLKAHAENPASEKLAPGISRLTVGGAIAALPPLTAWVKNTLSVGDNTGVAYTGFGTTF